MLFDMDNSLRTIHFNRSLINLVTIVRSKIRPMTHSTRHQHLNDQILKCLNYYQVISRNTVLLHFFPTIKKIQGKT